MKNKVTFKLTVCALLCSFATIAFTLEGLFPPIILPGARLGISNAIILFALIYLGAPYAFAVLLVKTLLGSLLGGNISAIMYSLPSGVIALTVEILIVYFIPKVSVIATSVVGSVINTLCQNLIFCLVTGSAEYIYYSPYLAVIAIFTGTAIGLITYLIIKKFPLRELDY